MSCSRKPWVPSACDGDLRDFLRVPMRTQGYCGVGRGLSGLHWVWCNGRGPHLEWSQEPQGSSPFRTPIAGSLQSWDRRVRPRLECKQRTPLSSRVTTDIYWSPLSGLKDFKPTVEFGERTRDCSPGHARKEGRHVVKTGASRRFSRAAASLWGFSRGTTGSSGSLSYGAREVRSPCAW